MILKSETDQSEFELQLTGYEFPHIKSEEHDANWLMVKIEVKSPVASWTYTDPSLQTIEAHDLANWLGDVAFNRNLKRRIFFTEPNLSFELVSRDVDICELRLYFALEFLPPGVEAAIDEFFLPFTVTAETLRVAANQLCQSLRDFPIRGNPRRWCTDCREV